MPRAHVRLALLFSCTWKQRGNQVKEGPFWFIYRDLLNPDLYYIKSQIEGKKSKPNGSNKKRCTYIFYILDFAGSLPLSKSVEFTEKSYHFAPIPFVLLILNSPVFVWVLWFFPLAKKYLKWIVHCMTIRRRPTWR